MSLNNDVLFKVAKVISEQLNVKQDIINENSNFKNLEIDELDQIEIIMKLEDLFNIEITDEQLEQMYQVKDLVNCIQVAHS